MKKKRFLKNVVAVFLCMVLVLPVLAVSAPEKMDVYAYGEQPDANGFLIVDGVLKKYSGTANNVVIPNGVTSIGFGAFSSCYTVESVTIPNSVTSIDMQAFYNCSYLKSITIPNGVKSIGTYAFYKCSNLKSIVIPESVTNIGSSVFGQCKNLTIQVVRDSYAHRYVMAEKLSYIIIGEPYIVTLSGLGNVSKASMDIYIDKNDLQDVIFKTEAGLTFFFEKGTMKPVSGKSYYTFGTVNDRKEYIYLINPFFMEDEFTFQINFYNDGALPGTAKISIPVAESKWKGKRLYYYKMNLNGEYDYVYRNTVASDGTYSIVQDYCSGDYIATTKKPENLGNADGLEGITTNDALAILKYDVGIAQKNFIPELADCDGVAGITASDALMVLKYDVGLIHEFY